VDSKIATAIIFVVSKKKCPACIQAKDLLRKLASKTGVLPEVLELHNYSSQQVKMIIKHLSAKTGIKTVPQIFINGRFIGGNDDIYRIYRKGRLVSLIGSKINIAVSKTSSSSPSFLRQSKGNSPIEIEVFSTPIKRKDANKYLSLKQSRNVPFYSPSSSEVDNK